MLKKNLIVAQSGGPTSAINATLCGVIKQAYDSGFENIYGGLNGIQGILEERLVDLKPIASSQEKLELLAGTPSSFLGTCRYKMKSPEQNPDDYARVFEIIEKYEIGYFFYIGGNDSMDTVLKLSKCAEERGCETRFIGIPKTIDNDLPITDHTPGFGSAAKYIGASVKEIAADALSYDLHSVTIIEVMGRAAGWLALAGMLARNSKGEHLCDLIYFPEYAFEFDDFLRDIHKVQEHKKQVIVVVSEGLKNADGHYLSEGTEVDSFGHKQLGALGSRLENFVKENLPGRVRSIELSLLQRCGGHMQSKTDIEEGIEIGKFGMRAALDGKTGEMVAVRRLSSKPYTYELFMADVSKIANQEKFVPVEYVNEAHNFGTPAAMEYLLPLTAGEMPTRYHEGVPMHLHLCDYLDA